MKRRWLSFLLQLALMLFFGVWAVFSAWIPGAEADQDLGFKLVGTVVADDPSKNFAIIEIQSTGNQGAYREGDRLGEVVLKKILSGQIVIGTKTGDQMLYMSSGGASAGRTPSSGEMARLDQKEVDATFPERMQLMRAIGVRPHVEAGRPSGILIYNIDPASIFPRMGLENGDVIIAVNGKPVTSTQQTVEFYDALKKGGTVSLEIKRGESKRELHFVIQ